MTIAGTVSFSGRVKYVPPVPYLDSSGNPGWFADVLEQMACSQRKEDEYILTADGAMAINLNSLPNGFNAIMLKVAPNVGIPPSPIAPDGVPAAPNPIVATLTSAAGTAPISVDGFMLLFSQTVPYTAMSITRTPGVQTVVRVQLWTVGS